MSTFSVGDRVVVVKSNHADKKYIGDRGTIARFQEDAEEYEVGVYFAPHIIRNFDASELEFENVYDELSKKSEVVIDVSISEEARGELFKRASSPASEVEVSPDEAVNHPSHYTAHPSGVECIQVTEHMNFNLGNATKYVWRAGLKSDDPIQDLQKARWYIEREIQRLGGPVD